jgi:hypothetical protein
LAKHSYTTFSNGIRARARNIAPACCGRYLRANVIIYEATGVWATLEDQHDRGCHSWAEFAVYVIHWYSA